MNPIIATLVRHGLTVAAGVLGARYGVAVEPDTIEAVSAGLCGALAVGWSVWEKRRAARG